MDSPAAAAQTGPGGVRATKTLGFRVVKHIFRQESSPKWKEEVGNRAHPTTARGRQGPLAKLSAGAQTRTFRRNVPTRLAAVPGCAHDGMSDITALYFQKHGEYISPTFATGGRFRVF